MTRFLFKKNDAFSSLTIGLAPGTKESVREENASYDESAIRTHMVISFSNLKFIFRKEIECVEFVIVLQKKQVNLLRVL